MYPSMPRLKSAGTLINLNITVFSILLVPDVGALVESIWFPRDWRVRVGGGGGGAGGQGGG